MIGESYQWIDRHLRPHYQDEQIFKIFERVYQEHFTVVAEKIVVRPSEEMGSGFVQSPDDLDAAYREKNGHRIKGHVISIVETATPENGVNLITDVVVKPVNTDDSTILNERLDIIKDKTPEIEELHFDGGYGSETNDQKMLVHEITPVQTAIRGRSAGVEIVIEVHQENGYQVSCPLQSVVATATRKRLKACFNKSVCKICPHNQDCRLIEQKNCWVYYFRPEDY
ncbi:DDE transposase, partial [bacterium]|nr:DDE transposase [bacterium]